MTDTKPTLEAVRLAESPYAYEHSYNAMFKHAVKCERELAAIKDAVDEAGHELGLWPMGALAVVARLKSEREQLIEKVKYYESITTGAQHKAIDAAIDSARNK